MDAQWICELMQMKPFKTAWHLETSRNLRLSSLTSEGVWEKICAAVNKKNESVSQSSAGTASETGSRKSNAECWFCDDLKLLVPTLQMERLQDAAQFAHLLLEETVFYLDSCRIIPLCSICKSLRSLCRLSIPKQRLLLTSSDHCNT